MDIQSILDNSFDSSSSSPPSTFPGGVSDSLTEEDESNMEYANAYSKLLTTTAATTTTMTNTKYYSASLNGVDLEQILREDDDDLENDGDQDDDDDDDDDDDNDDDDDLLSGPTSLPPKSWSQSLSTPTAITYAPTSSASATGEDWDVLQAILGEDDDEEDDDGSGDAMMTMAMMMKMTAGVSDARPGYHNNNNDWKSVSFLSNDSQTGPTVNVDSILQQSDDEGDISFDGQISPILHSPIRSNKDWSLGDDVQPATCDSYPIVPQSVPDIQSLSIAPTNSSLGQPSDWDLEKASERALQYEEEYERKLFKSGHRDIVSPLMVKRRLKPKIELNTKNQQQQRNKTGIRPSTNSANIPRFAFSGAIENKHMEGISLTLLKSMPDLPTALCVNSRFIAIGTQRGAILVFDLFETFRKKLTNGGDTPFNIKTAGSVTTIDLSLIHGEFLAAGYTSGYIVLWDTIRGVALRTVIENLNPSPITNIRFLNELKLVTVDAGGLVHKLTFAKNILWSSYSVESECLLDGTAGQILAMNVLDPYPAVHQQLPLATPAMKKIVLIALSSERSSFAVAVEPTVHVLHRWAKPTEEQMIPSIHSVSSKQIYLPCLSWGWAMLSGGGNSATPILARAWGCAIQLLRASFPEEDPEMPQEVFPWPAFGVQDEFQSSAPVVALEWLNDRSLVYLTVSNEFTVVDTVMMTLLERLDFSGFRLVYAEFSLSRKAENEEASFCTTFQNSIRSRDNRLLLLCQEELKAVSIIGAKRRISALEQDGEWLEALASALDHYENTVSSQQDRRRDPQGRRDVSKHPEYTSITKSEDEEWIAKLLIRYLNIAVENAPEFNEYELAQSHFQMLAGVCVEFCVVTKRLDLLFGPIFRRFLAVGFLSVFLDVLEPYILNDKLDYIAPEAMAHFVEHCRSTNGIATVERCLLHMDVTIMDFDTILSLLRANEMYSALFYVFNQGLNDYTSPLEILLEKIFDAGDTTNPKFATGQRKDGAPRNDMERYGYKAILYLQYCFKGNTFPQDMEIENLELKATIRSQLLEFLLQRRFSPTSFVKKSAQVIGQRAQPYPYTHILLMVDPKAMLDTLCLAMDAVDNFGRDAKYESIEGWEVEAYVERPNGQNGSKKAPDREEIVGMLLAIIMPESLHSIQSPPSIGLHRSERAVNALLDFLAEYLRKGLIRVNKQVTFMILNRMAARFETATEPHDRLLSQKQILQLLTALPRNSYEAEEILVLVQKSGVHRAALLLHQEGASPWGNSESQQERDRRSFHFRAAIDCYLDDDDPDFRRDVFAYVKKECSGSSDEGSDRELQPNVLLDALASKLASLVQLDSLLTAELVAELFVEDLDLVIEKLDDEHAQFRFFQAIISGDLDQKDHIAGSVLNANLTMEHHHKYLALMAKIHPEEVYDYLQTHDNYRPETCLPICQKYDIADASCYLFERMGNVSSGLQLILQTLECRMMGLKRSIRGMGTESYNRYSMPRHPLFPWKRRDNQRIDAYDITEQEIDGVKRVLIVALDLCERNSGTFSSRTEHGSQLWFNVLDRLINAKGFLRLANEQPGHAKLMASVLSELLRLTMQRMVSSVPLPDLVRKVTSDHSGSRLGELREMVESLLGTYGFELNVFSGAVNVFHFDACDMRKQHRALRVQGSIVRKIMNVPLDEKTKVHVHKVVESALDRDILQLTEFGNAGLVDVDGASKMPSSSKPRIEQGLGDSLSRLRHRRRAMRSIRPTAPRVRSLSFMTDKEELHCHGELSPDATYFEDRIGGVLGNAEHRGRLLAFLYQNDE